MLKPLGHTIHSHQRHQDWDNSIPPVLTIAPGDEVRFETVDAWGGEVTRESTAAEVPGMSLEIGNPTTGPVYVDGAEPGDALKITLLGFEGCGWGWTCVCTGFGILPDAFPGPELMHWQYDDRWATSRAGRVPVKMFPGTIGTALAAPGRHSVVPPYRTGGNLDVRDLGEGSVLYLPVEVKGALFSLGDTHAAQGDGEVCGAAIETAIAVQTRVELVKDARLGTPRFTTPGPVCRHLDEKGYEVTTGIGPSLMENARAAVLRMCELMSDRHGLPPADVYMLASCCADLRISVYAGDADRVVSCYFPRLVLE
ncbi:MAG: acetamidase [Alphaproteobacteria bacterium]|nr:acetamidase [Alphaproteobacteria bacterium]